MHNQVRTNKQRRVQRRLYTNKRIILAGCQCSCTTDHTHALTSAPSTGITVTSTRPHWQAIDIPPRRTHMGVARPQVVCDRWALVRRASGWRADCAVHADGGQGRTRTLSLPWAWHWQASAWFVPNAIGFGGCPASSSASTLSVATYFCCCHHEILLGAFLVCHCL